MHLPTKQPITRSSSTPLGLAGVAHPFEVQPVAGEAKVVIVPGTIFGLWPTLGPFMGALPINSDPQPQLTITISGIIYANCVLTEGVVTSVQILNAATPSSDNPTAARITLASLVLTGAVVRVTGQAIRTSLWHRRCNGINEFWRV